MQRGQTTAEYAGALLLAAVIVAVVVSSGIVGSLAGAVDDAVCKLLQQPSCGQTAPAQPQAQAPAATVDPARDSDGDGIPDIDDPVPASADGDGDGLLDAEEIALGSDPANADSDGDGVPDGEEFDLGSDPASGVEPMTPENALRPWERVGMTEAEWAEFTQAILDEANPSGWQAVVFGKPYYGVTLDEHGQIVLLQVLEAGLNPGPILRALGVGGRLLSTGEAVTRAAARLSAATRAALAARGVLPAAARIRPPAPPSLPGTAFGELDALGRTTGASATITRELLNTGTAAARSITPAGYTAGAGQARGHLIARLLGGSGTDARNLATIYQNPVNTPIMRGFEQQVANAVRAGETVQYTVTPIYRGAELVPRAFTLRATGSGGFNLHVSILNRIP